MRESFSTELKSKVLTLNNHVPRIARRVEQALKDLGIGFHKTRPTRLFLTKVATEPDKVLTGQSLKQFDELFKIVNSRLQAHVERNERPFGG
ncbi:hypothetical protein [Burkholderia cepacia]|uniref:hypothetical protein n=1 Tax=Burkholderia cepacia TaxID=292 RepID=UPI002AB6945C|nr:hypothetical protein [Burkholderia cepacia]